jgi:hypothetical protein
MHQEQYQGREGRGRLGTIVRCSDHAADRQDDGGPFLPHGPAIIGSSMATTRYTRRAASAAWVAERRIDPMHGGPMAEVVPSARLVGSANLLTWRHAGSLLATAGLHGPDRVATAPARGGAPRWRVRDGTR